MDTCDNAVRENHHVVAERRLLELGDAIVSLERLKERVSGVGIPKEVAVQNKPCATPSLVEFLSSCGDTLNGYAVRIDKAVEDLTQMLY